MTQQRAFTRKGVAIGATIVLAGALAAAVPASASARSARPNGAAKISSAKIHLAGVSNPGAIKAPPAAAAHSKPRVMPLLKPRAGNAKAGVVPRVQGAAKPKLRPATTGMGQILSNFDGINAIQNEQTAFPLEPPDEGLGAGAGYVVNFVNVTGGIYRGSGRMVGAPFYLNPFFHEADAANTSDPRVFYDSSSHRWFATILVYSLNSAGTRITGSHVDLAVSTSANPTGSWVVYKIPTSNVSHAGCPCLADYPILGVDQYNVYISTNEFTSDESSFNGAQLYAVSKSQVVAGRRGVNIAKFENLTIAGAPAFHVQPANTYGNAAAEWMMNSLDPNGTSDHRLGVWALTNPQAVSAGGTPGLSVRVIQSEGYSFPPKAQTPPGYCTACGAPTTGKVDTDWDAMQEVQYINGQLVGALNTGITVAGDTTDRSGVAWFVVRPSLTGSTVGTGTHVARQGYLAAQGLYLLYPHLNMTQNGAMAVTFGFGGPGTFLSAGYSVAAPGRAFHSIQVAAAGTGPDNGFTGTAQYGGLGRWGDYSNGEIIPGTNRVWLATQYIPNNGGQYTNWGNRIFELNLG
jgi:hypothetical protein